MTFYMTTRVLKLSGLVLLLVIGLSFFHCYIDSDHLCLHHRPTGRSLSAAAADEETCLCFTHGYFMPVAVPSQAGSSSLEAPVPAFAESPRPAIAGDIDHPPLA